MSVLFKSDVLNLLEKNDAKDKMKFGSPNILRVCVRMTTQDISRFLFPTLVTFYLSPVRVKTGVR